MSEQLQDPVDETGLTEREMRIIIFERQWWKHAGSKERKIASEFGLNALQYYQVLNDLIDRPEALAYDPMVVRRLRKTREERRQLRRR